MCGRMIVLGQEELRGVIEQMEQARAPGPLPPAASPDSVRPGAQVAVVVPGGDGRLGPRFMRWGFALSRNGKLVYNTRVESAVRGGMWAAAMECGRCIVPVRMFFEPHRSEVERSTASGRPVKRPYVFEAPDGRALLLAGVSERGQLSIVTTKPNPCVAPVHDRMPLVLEADELDEWLCGDCTRLADRSGVDLAAHPEHPAASAIEQQALF